jgi:CheY-like chemotaxis protein
MPSVLIVDDEPNIRRMVGALLSAEGYDVRDAADGGTGLALAEANEPDIALVDLMMPGDLDGLGLLEKLRERAGFLRVWRLLTAARKPIVGHNLTYDLLFLMSHFHRSPLPSTLAECKATLHELFPQVRAVMSTDSH